MARSFYGVRHAAPPFITLFVMLVCLLIAGVSSAYAAKPPGGGDPGGGTLPPTVSVTATPTSGKAPLTVKFTSTGKNIVTCDWDFADGGISSQRNPTHTFQATGLYNVIVVVSNGNGDEASASITIRVANDPPPPQPSPAVVNLPWNWSLGDDFIGAGVNGLLNVTVAPSGTTTLHAEGRAQGKVFYVPLDVLRAQGDFVADQQKFTAKVDVYAMGQNIYHLDKAYRDVVDEKASPVVSGYAPFLYTYFDLGPVTIGLYGEVEGSFGADYRFYATGGGHAEAKFTPHVDSRIYVAGYGDYFSPYTWDYVEGGVYGLFRLVGERADLIGKVDLGNNGQAYADISWNVSETTSALSGEIGAWVEGTFYGYPFGYEWTLWSGNGPTWQKELFSGSKRFYLPSVP